MNAESTPAAALSMYRELKAEEIVATANRLQNRIRERFPESGLLRVCGELCQTIAEIAELANWIRRPQFGFRILTGVMLVLMVAGIIGGISRLKVRLTVETAPELLQGLEAGVNDVVFIGLAVFFLFGWEARRKRNRALRSIHQLRSLAHIVDMHQLTKDPERVTRPSAFPQSKGKRVMTPFELTRYLDYCSEMLSLISKAAVLHVQGFNDPITLAAVEQIEDLTNSLSRKMWQKIMILDRTLALHPE